MKQPLKFLLLTIGLTLGATTFAELSHADNHTDLDKFVDFKALNNIYGEPKVRINMEKAMLNLIGGLAQNQDPQAAELLQSLQAVTVNVYNIGADAEAAKDSVRAVSEKLEESRWMPAVSVNEGDEMVRIFIKEADGLIEGLLVMAVGNNNEAAFINIVGNIDPSKIAQVAQSLNLDVNLGAGSN